MLFIALLLMFAAMATFVISVVPVVVGRGSLALKQNTARFVYKYEAVLTDEQIKKMQKMFLLVPVLLIVLTILYAPPELKIGAFVAAVVFGILIPRLYLSFLIKQRKRKFDDQLVDAMMIMMSSFRGGLSLIQAFEAVVDEMPEPAKQEFGIVLGENRMGVPLDESLNRLYKRMPSPSLQQMITAILLAKETGGNLALIFARIINTKRERKKIEQNLQTLTVQGKIQALVMTALPLIFYGAVSASNPRFFDGMKSSHIGQMMLLTCGILWLVGTVIIIKISTFKDT